MLEAPSFEESVASILRVNTSGEKIHTSATAVTIRSADFNDLPAIACILVDTWRTTFDGLLAASFLNSLSYAQQEERHRKTMSNGNSLYYLAADETGNIVGFINVGPDRSTEEPCDAEIYALYIRQENQGQGIGRQLIRTASTALAVQGKQTLRVWALNNNPFKRFYLQLGAQSEQLLPIQLGAEQYTQESFVWKDFSQLLN